MIPFKPRPKQAEVLAYTGGLMGVAAVPGSGKTRTLSYLAAQLVAESELADGQEVLIVTLVNAAANHFSQQVGQFVRARGLLPGFGYRVRTLHGLANDIVRERPGLVGLDKDFKILDERESGDILLDAVSAWTRTHHNEASTYIDTDYDASKQAYILRDKWEPGLRDIAGAFIKQAKDEELEPADIHRALDRYVKQYGYRPGLAAICAEIYTAYQRSLSYRGGVDFQDLIRLALRALRDDPDYLARLRLRWPYILEDEAQDSSRLQEKILTLLAGEGGNWVRVGDPNQAIYETFTTARPEHLRDFMARDDVQARALPNSGRSTQSIIDMANYLITWSSERHPVDAVRQRAPLAAPYIEPTPPGDPQPNPPDDPQKVVLYEEDLPPRNEIDLLTRSLKRWLPENPDKTVAVLVPSNHRGADMVKAFKEADLEVVELLRSSSTTRETAGALTYLLEAFSNPNVSASLAQAFRVWRRDDRDDEATNDRVRAITAVLRGCRQVEDYLYPRTDQDWLDTEPVMALRDRADGDLCDALLREFRVTMRRWQAAVALPVDQLVLTLAADLFHTAADLAIAHSLAIYLRRAGEAHPEWRLPDYMVELRAVARNQRRLLDLGDDGSTHDPDAHKGKVTVATMHAAKGLEWDRVYLTSVSNYDFPSAEPGDQFISEVWWARDGLNLQAEALAQLESLRSGTQYREGDATQVARVDYAAERLRLLYVGITRARRELVLTWNTGRYGDTHQATPFVALSTWWQRHDKTPASSAGDGKRKKKQR
ncbi:MAG: ATP-dependent helicase [Chloroflexota bacterium]